MSKLEPILLRRIALDGPLSVADYMALCLSHPEHGYYTTRDPLKEFTTAPEISQMFGELLGLWCVLQWQAQGAPRPFALVELGPGRGTLMADMLRATQGVPGFDAAEVVLVETSPALRALQKDRLSHTACQWIESVEALPNLPLFVVANEFFDALPIRQFVFDGAWRERMIGGSDRLSFGLSPPADLDWPSAAPGTFREICPQGEGVMQTLGARTKSQGGAILTVDYGDWDGFGNTLQSLKDGEPSDPLQSPGTADLTAHVRFRALAGASGLGGIRFTTQGAFLAAMGIGQRAAALAKAPGAADSVSAALHRLTATEEMGEVFKVLALTPSATDTVPGFETQR